MRERLAPDEVSAWTIAPLGPQSACTVIRYAAIGVVLCFSMPPAKAVHLAASAQMIGARLRREARSSEVGGGAQGDCPSFWGESLLSALACN